ncbi:sulfur carrier protein ThiS [Alicyclobacillus dauci]|uniref:Sulfur carrier protein ThiS n=1 Tax=Alicyclobacillus dauci TaxID=1475485 RepID=A0ABY6Z2R3_9BACL|nr:sulfur carrier protein ThiS [Alicyclobacillus dauci]WAH36967.1 sulfur carrier protein ThiS [Alicyclobacillus dauci]
MNITVNGKLLDVQHGITVQHLLHELELGDERIAVEYNKRILETQEYPSVLIEEGATVEVVRFVGGG